MEGRHLEESEFVERARNGDIGAYEALIRMHQDLALRTAYVIAGASDAQDAVQEAFVKAYAALDRFRPGAPFRPWLLRIVANEAIDRKRATRRAATLALRVAHESGLGGLSGAAATVERGASGVRPLRDAGPSPEGAALAREQQEELVAAVNRLRPEDRLVIAYRFWFELTEAEMAEALACARGTVKSRLSRALRRLREVLGQAQPAPGDRAVAWGVSDA